MHNNVFTMSLTLYTQTLTSLQIKKCRTGSNKCIGSVFYEVMGNNDLRTEDSVITKWGYLVAIASTVFGLCCFLIGRKRHKKEPR